MQDLYDIDHPEPWYIRRGAHKGACIRVLYLGASLGVLFQRTMLCEPWYIRRGAHKGACIRVLYLGASLGVLFQRTMLCFDRCGPIRCIAQLVFFCNALLLC